MDKHVQISILCEIYGKLLTEKQLNAINDYYNNDMSLTEIGNNYNISKQAVSDLIKKGEEKLFDYESTLGIMYKTKQNKNCVKTILAQIEKIEKFSSEKDIIRILDEIKNKLNEIE